MLFLSHCFLPSFEELSLRNFFMILESKIPFGVNLVFSVGDGGNGKLIIMINY